MSDSVSLNAIKKISVVVSLCCPSTTTDLFAKPAFSSLITIVPKKCSNLSCCFESK